MVLITGIGWVNSTEYGCILRDIRADYNDNMTLKKGIFTEPYKNFGRIDTASRITCCAAALALKDAGIECSRDRKQNIGIIGTNNQGSLETDMNYFKDYLDNNRTSSRGNLFIYTLPTSPLGEAAIQCGLLGPLLYIASPDDQLTPVVDMAAKMVRIDEAPVMLAGMSREHESVYFVLRRNSDCGQVFLCNMEQAMTVLKKGMAFNEMINEFAVLRKGNNRQ